MKIGNSTAGSSVTVLVLHSAKLGFVAGLFPSPGLLRCMADRQGISATHEQRRRAGMSEMAATTLLVRSAAYLVGWRSQPEPAPRALPGWTLCWRLPGFERSLRHNVEPGTCHRRCFLWFSDRFRGRSLCEIVGAGVPPAAVGSVGRCGNGHRHGSRHRLGHGDGHGNAADQLPCRSLTSVTRVRPGWARSASSR